VGYASTIGKVDICIPKNSICCVGVDMPMSLECLNSTPKSVAMRSIRLQAWINDACVGAAMRMLSI
jgi:hypothetical protein